MQKEELSPIEKEWARQAEQHKARLKEDKEKRALLIEKQKAKDNDIDGLSKKIRNNAMWFYGISILIILFALKADIPNILSYAFLGAGILNFILMGLLHLKKSVVAGAILLVLFILDSLYSFYEIVIAISSNSSSFPLGMVIGRIAIIIGIAQIIILVRKYNKAVVNQNVKT